MDESFDDVEPVVGEAAQAYQAKEYCYLAAASKAYGTLNL